MLYEEEIATLQHDNSDIYIKLHKVLTQVHNTESGLYIIIFTVAQNVISGSKYGEAWDWNDQVWTVHEEDATWTLLVENVCSWWGLSYFTKAQLN